MLSNQILHKTAQDIREITGFDCAIWDMQGFCLVRTNETLTGYEIQIQDFRDDEEEPEEMILDEMGMFRIYEDSDPAICIDAAWKCRRHGTGRTYGSQSASESSLCIQRTDG